MATLTRRAAESVNTGPFEAGQFGSPQTKTSAYVQTGEVFCETERLELASDLLEVASEAQLDRVLTDLISRVGQAVGKFISAPEGCAIARLLKGPAKRVLSGIELGRDAVSDLGRYFGLELEGLSNEDREFEIARHYIGFAGEAVKNLALASASTDSRRAADAAMVEAAKTHAPGLLQSRGGAKIRAYVGPSPVETPPLPVPLLKSEVFATNSWEFAEGEFDGTRGRPSSPRYLRFMNLDKFIWNKASLTPDLWQKVELLARHVKLSWRTMHPIANIALIGHTDITGPEKYNRRLGNWRAAAVKKALEHLLKEDMLERRVAITTEPSPGASAPTVGNRTAEGRALNRRVEVFVAPPEPSEQARTFDWTIHDDPNPSPSSVFDFGKRIPPGSPPGKSFREWLDDVMEKIGVRNFLRTQIWNAIFNQGRGILSQLLEQANIKGALEDSIINAARGVGEVKI